MASVSGYALLPAPPPALPLWGKVVWYLVETAASGIAWKQFEASQEITPTADLASDPTADEWRRWVFIWDDTNSLEGADNQQFSVDIVNYTNGAIDSTWTDQDHQDCEDELLVFAAAVASATASRYHMIELKAYRMAFKPYPPPGTTGKLALPFAESGPPTWSKVTTIPGGGASTMPPQVTSTITERTPSRANWGRMYLPTLAVATVLNTGRLSTTAADALAQAYATLATELLTHDMVTIVPTTSVNEKPTRTLQQVTACSVDDVVDVHRRRRHRRAAYHAIRPVAATTRPASSP